MRIASIALFFAGGFFSVLACAKPLHCDPTYQGKPFVQVTIWSGIDGIGPAECDYKNPHDKQLTVYHLSDKNEYYSVAGDWQSTMPGYRWCTAQAASCLFAKREPLDMLLTA